MSARPTRTATVVPPEAPEAIARVLQAALNRSRAHINHQLARMDWNTEVVGVAVHMTGRALTAIQSGTAHVNVTVSILSIEILKDNPKLGYLVDLIHQNLAAGRTTVFAHTTDGYVTVEGVLRPSTDVGKA